MTKVLNDTKNEILETLDEYVDELEVLKLNLNTPEATLKVLSRIEQTNNKVNRVY